MAIPTQPTLTTISQEGLKRAGYPSPPTVLVTRAADWVEEVKWDIWNKDKKYKSLLVTAYGVTTKGVSRYACPSDYESDLSVTILDGAHTGTLQVATANTATLAATEDISEDFGQGKFLLITSGTGIGACSQITAFNTTTKVATVTPNFNTTPDGTENYMIVDTFYPLEPQPISRKDDENYPHDKQIPAFFFPIGQANADDDETGEFELYPVPDDTYGMQFRYFINLMLIDLTSNLMKTLYRRWRNLWVQGVYYKTLQNDRDARWKDEWQIYKQMIEQLRAKEVYGMDFSRMQRVMEE